MKKRKLLSITLSVGVGALIALQPLNANASSNTLSGNTQYESNIVQKDINLGSYQKIESYIQSVKKQTDNRVFLAVNTQTAFYKILDSMYKELPTKITIKSSVPESTLKQWYESYQLAQVTSKQPNLHTLASYSFKKQIKATYVLKDNSNDKYSAKQIEMGTKLFAKDFAKQIKNFPQDVKIDLIYDYIYNQFKYEANSYKKMIVGNAYNGKLACNGFSRLFYELALASDIPVKIIESEDHFYNHVQTSTGKWVIIDTTTDILLKQKHGATGLPQEKYLNYVSKVGFYGAKPVSKETAVSDVLDKEEKEKLLKATNTLPKFVYRN